MDLTLFSCIEKTEQDYYLKKKQTISESDDCPIIDTIQQEELKNHEAERITWLSNPVIELNNTDNDIIEIESAEMKEYECLEQTMQVNDDHDDADDVSSQQNEKKGNLFHLDLLFDSLRVIETIITVVELIDSMKSQVSRQLYKETTNRQQESVAAPNKQSTDTAMIKPDNECTGQLDESRFKLSPVQANPGLSFAKISYFNSEPETELFKKVELILLKVLKNSYENLNDTLKIAYKYDELTIEICKFMFNQQVKLLENDKLRKFKNFKMRWYLQCINHFCIFI